MPLLTSEARPLGSAGASCTEARSARVGTRRLTMRVGLENKRTARVGVRGVEASVAWSVWSTELCTRQGRCVGSPA
eukprot:6831670-Alexandrium_andersonii.AAC.1